MPHPVRIAAALPALLFAWEAAHTAAAQPLAGALDGKTCQGIFNSGKQRAGSEGALQLQFAVEGGRLTAQMRRLVGKPAYDSAAYALTKDTPVDAAQYPSLGAVRDLQVAGSRVRYIDPAGARVSLEYKGGDLSGSSDPRGGSDPQMTRLQFLNLHCR